MTVREAFKTAPYRADKGAELEIFSVGITHTYLEEKERSSYHTNRRYSFMKNFIYEVNNRIEKKE